MAKYVDLKDANFIVPIHKEDRAPQVLERKDLPIQMPYLWVFSKILKN